MRAFHVVKAEDFEAALIEHGVGFEHPNDDPHIFYVADEVVDVVDDIARKMMLEVYIEDPFITQPDTESD